MNSNGWDVIYGCSVSLLNRRLAQEEKFALTVKLDLAVKIGPVEQVVPFQAKFTQWQIAPGGSGGYLVMQVLSSGQLGTDQPFQNLRTTLRVRIACLQQKNGAASIHLDWSRDGVQILNIDCDGIFSNPEQSLLRDFIKDAYTQTIQQSNAQLAFILAQIEGYSSASLSIMKFRYLWYQPVDETLEGFLLILGLLDETKDIATLPSMADHALLYDSKGKGYDTVFLLAAEAFNTRFMLSAMLQFYPGSSQDNYKMTSGHIVNNGDIPLASVKVSAVSYDPRITSFDFHIEDDKAVTVLYGKCPIKGLTKAFVDFSLSAKNQIAFAPVDQRLTFLPDPNLAVTANKDIPSWEEWIGILSLGILNVVMDSICESLEKSISGGLLVHGINASNLGIQTVNWKTDVAIATGGFADHLYIQCRSK